MAQKTAPARGARKSDRKRTLIYIVAVAVIFMGLIWTEQVAVLYLLATLGLTVLLLIVATADLGLARTPGGELAPNDDSAVMGDGLGATINSTSARAAKRR